ncbi:DUF3267 domain-containing protein [Salirhabdus salicampi]|uniref:DUF3267 domain-containing protein n=1 Tax=Salirhabdus salicampi TaxID=476102 RepID=UPI0020C43D3C|nr:DUF3267 domain-containing protein [Salirhabdus salicampi]MCP8615500.1 DUF3267 domain-containing protein [Salirhabdus salicampi]
MNCWKTVNITRELGQSRIYILSCIVSMLGFILLFLPFSLYHQNVLINDYGILPLLFVLYLLPLMHKLCHIIPLIMFSKKVKARFYLKLNILPSVKYRTFKAFTKKTSVFVALGPTLFLTIPALVSGLIFPSFYPYSAFFAALNMGLSITDFLYVVQFSKAPKQCVIENAKDGFDILIR